MNISIEQQAEEAFHRLSEIYNAPKLPEDIDYDVEGSESSNEPTSVYENLGLIKYLQPFEDPRGRVLTAIYYSVKGYSINLDEVLKMKFDIKVPDGIGIGFIKENSYVEIIFINRGQSWFDLGCRFYIKPSN